MNSRSQQPQETAAEFISGHIKVWGSIFLAVLFLAILLAAFESPELLDHARHFIMMQ